jgi:hypothetical protein
VTLDDPIPSLKWPRMEMEFSCAWRTAENPNLGDRVKFEMKAGKPGEFVITKIEPIAGPKTRLGYAGSVTLRQRRRRKRTRTEGKKPCSPA